MCSVLFDKLSFRNLEPVSIADCDPTNINYVDDNGITPLHRACIFHSRRFIELLVDHGADLNRQCVHLGQTPFHYACMNQALGLEDFQFLVGQGGYLETRPERGNAQGHCAPVPVGSRGVRLF